MWLIRGEQRFSSVWFLDGVCLWVSNNVIAISRVARNGFARLQWFDELKVEVFRPGVRVLMPLLTAIESLANPSSRGRWLHVACFFLVIAYETLPMC
jgi:hypothetical protein